MSEIKSFMVGLENAHVKDIREYFGCVLGLGCVDERSVAIVGFRGLASSLPQLS